MTPPRAGDKGRAAEAPAPNSVTRAPERTGRGPQALGAVLPAVTRPAFRKQSPAGADLFATWPDVVGPALARVTEPRRLSAGTLTIGCVGPVALELQHLAGPLMERINLHLGRALVQRLRFVQEARVPVRDPLPPPAPPPRLDPAAIEGVAEGPLREALASLGAWVLRDRA